MASGYETRGAGHGLVATVTHTREGGGGQRPQKTSLCPSNRPAISGPFDESPRFLGKNCLMLVGGSGGGAQAAIPPVGGWVGVRPPPFSGSFYNFHFCPEEKFSDLVGGWVGQNPRKARTPPPPRH